MVNQDLFLMKNGNPLVSVCVVTYQHKSYIKKCLDGILSQQTDFKFEIILGEDESDDGTREICKEYSKKHPEIIRLFLRSRNDVIFLDDKPTGRSNYTQNLKVAKGKFIAICDGDDYWTDPLKLQKQISFLNENPDHTICFTSTSILKKDGKIYKRDSYKKQASTNFSNIVLDNYIPSSTAVFKNIFLNYDLPTWFYQVYVADWALYLILVRDGGKIGFLNFDSTVYREGIGISKDFHKDPLKIYLNHLDLKMKILKDDSFSKFTNDINSSIVMSNQNIMSFYNKRKNYNRSLQYFYNLMRIRFSFKIFKVFLYSIKLGILNKY
jgi:glycosyltransferase involved in cell wall biosynthesis